MLPSPMLLDDAALSEGYAANTPVYIARTRRRVCEGERGPVTWSFGLTASTTRLFSCHPLPRVAREQGEAAPGSVAGYGHS